MLLREVGRAKLKKRGREGKVLLREVGRAKFTNKLITCLELKVETSMPPPCQIFLELIP